GIERARTRDGDDDPRTSAGAGVAIGHVPGALLVPVGDQANCRLVDQGVEDRQVLGSRYSEDHLDTLGLERLNKRLPAGHARHGASSGRISCILLKGRRRVTARSGLGSRGLAPARLSGLRRTGTILAKSYFARIQ